MIRTYTFGHDLLAQDQRDGTGTWSATWYGYDGHGSVRLLTDGAGRVTDRYDYEAFGTLLHGEGTTFNRYRYCGEQYDGALGLYYLHARFMNAASGRFWNADTYEGSGGDPQSLHRYLYCGGDSVNGLDPTGHMTMAEVMAAGTEIANLALRATPSAFRATAFVVEALTGQSVIVGGGIVFTARAGSAALPKSGRWNHHPDSDCATIGAGNKGRSV